MEKSNIKKIFKKKNGEQYPISFELKDGTLMVNATQMGKAFGEYKKPIKFLRNRQTQEFINEMKRSPNLDFGENNMPYITIKGGSDLSKQGTWMHEKLALNYAMWLSPEFANWVIDNITILLKTGKVELPIVKMQQLQDHVKHQVQRNNTKDVARKIYIEADDGDRVKSIISYHHKSLMALTNMSKSDWVYTAKTVGLPKSIINKGGKEIIRQLKPEIACAMSLADNIIASTKTLKAEDQEYVIDTVKKSFELFEGIIKIGAKPNELNQ